MSARWGAKRVDEVTRDPRVFAGGIRVRAVAAKLDARADAQQGPRNVA